MKAVRPPRGPGEEHEAADEGLPGTECTEAVHAALCLQLGSVERRVVCARTMGRTETGGVAKSRAVSEGGHKSSSGFTKESRERRGSQGNLLHCAEVAP